MDDIATLGIAVNSGPVNAASQALDKLARAAAPAQAQIDKLTAAASSSGKALQGTAQGAASYTASLKEGQAAITAHTAALGAHARGFGSVRDQMNRTRMEGLELIHVIRSLGEQMAAGVNPMRALTMESARITTLFSNGGMGGVLKNTGELVGKIAGSWWGLAGAIAGTTAIAAAAAIQFEASENRIANSVNGIGRRSGLSLGQINAIASQVPNLSAPTARGLAATYVSAGIPGSLLPGLLGSTRKYSDITGQSLDASAKELAAGAASPIKGLDELSKRFGDVDAATRILAASQMAMGDRLAAERTYVDQLNKSLAGATDNTFKFNQGIQFLGQHLEDFWGRLGRNVASLFGATPQDQEKAARASLANAQQMIAYDQARGLDPTLWMHTAAQAQATIAGFDRQRAQVQQNAAQQQAVQLGSDATATIRRLLPDVDRQFAANNQYGLLSRTMSNPAAVDEVEKALTALGVPTTELSHALDVATEASTHYVSALGKIQQESALRVQSIEAETFAQRTLADMQRAYVTELDSTHDRLLAAASAEAARAEAMANAQRRADDNLRSAQDKLALAGQTPYERGLMEIGFRYRDLNRETAGNIPAMAPFASDLQKGSSALGDFANAVMTATASVGGRGVPSSPYGTLGPFRGGVPSSLAPIFAQASAASGVPASILEAVAKQESGFTNPANGQGVMQITSGTATQPGYGLAPIDLSDRSSPAIAIPWSAKYLAARAGNIDWSNPFQASTALTRYNGGGDALYAQHVLGNVGAGPTNAIAQASETAAYQQQATLAPLTAANNALSDRSRLLTAEAAASSKGTAAMAAAQEQQQLLNKYIDDGVPITKELSDALDQYGLRAAAVAQAEEDRQRSIAGNDMLKGGTSDIADAWISAQTTRRRNVGDYNATSRALRSAAQQLGIKTAEGGVTSLLGDVFGGKGTTAGSGIFGSLLSSLLGGASGLPGSGLFAGFGMAEGGIMTSRGPIRLQRYADGGVASSPTIAMYGEGRDPEAIIPLKSGAVPVSLRGIRQSNQSLVVHGGDIVVQGSVDPKTMAQLRSELDARDAALHDNILRNLATLNSRNQSYYAQ